MLIKITTDTSPKGASLMSVNEVSQVVAKVCHGQVDRIHVYIDDDNTAIGEIIETLNLLATRIPKSYRQLKVSGDILKRDDLTTDEKMIDQFHAWLLVMVQDITRLDLSNFYLNHYPDSNLQNLLSQLPNSITQLDLSRNTLFNGKTPEAWDALISMAQIINEHRILKQRDISWKKNGEAEVARLLSGFFCHFFPMLAKAKVQQLPHDTQKVIFSFFSTEFSRLEKLKSEYGNRGAIAIAPQGPNVPA